MLNRSIRYAIKFSIAVKTDLASSNELLKLTMLLYITRARQQSFYSTGFSSFRFEYNGLRYDPAPKPARYLHFAISEGNCFSQDTSRAIILT